MKVLVVDDHPIVRSGLRRLLAAAEPSADIDEAEDGREALARVRENRPDLVLLDLNLPGLGGLELLQRLCSGQGPTLRVIVFSMHAEAIFAKRALENGAAGYLSKNAAPDEVLEAVRHVVRDGRYIERGIAQELALSAVDRRAAGGDPLQDLSPRDIEILRQVAGGAGLADIAASLGLGYKTVANTLSRIKARLGVARTADLVRIAIENGIR